MFQRVKSLTEKEKKALSSQKLGRSTGLRDNLNQILLHMTIVIWQIACLNLVLMTYRLGTKLLEKLVTKISK